MISGVATGWTGVDMSTPLLLEVAPKTDTNPTSFYRGKRQLGSVRSLRLQTPVIGSCSVLAMSVHPTYFDLAMPLFMTHRKSPTLLLIKHHKFVKNETKKSTKVLYDIVIIHQVKCL